MKLSDTVGCKGRIRVEKFDSDGNLIGVAEGKNLFLTVGATEMWKLVIGSSVNTFNNAQATIGIGDSTTAAIAGQTDLQAAANKTYKAMDSNYPETPAGGAVTFAATFGANDANYVWNEFTVKQATSAICINRGVQNLGSKVAGTTWVVTVTLSIS